MGMKSNRAAAAADCSAAPDSHHPRIERQPASKKRAKPPAPPRRQAPPKDLELNAVAFSRSSWRYQCAFRGSLVILGYYGGKSFHQQRRKKCRFEDRLGAIAASRHGWRKRSSTPLGAKPSGTCPI